MLSDSPAPGSKIPWINKTSGSPPTLNVSFSRKSCLKCKFVGPFNDPWCRCWNVEIICIFRLGPWWDCSTRIKVAIWLLSRQVTRTAVGSMFISWSPTEHSMKWRQWLQNETQTQQSPIPKTWFLTGWEQYTGAFFSSVPARETRTTREAPINVRDRVLAASVRRQLHPGWVFTVTWRSTVRHCLMWWISNTKLYPKTLARNSLIGSWRTFFLISVMSEETFS